MAIKSKDIKKKEKKEMRDTKVLEQFKKHTEKN